MAFRLALTVLCLAAVCSASPLLIRLQRAAEPAQSAKVQQFPAAKPAAQPKAVVFQAAPPPQPAAYQAVQVVAAPAVPVAKAAAAVSNSVANNQQAQVTGQSYEFNPADNSFAYSFQTNNGISQQAKGYINAQGKYVQEGSYTLYTPEGLPVSISYIADENGYQAVGDAIPQPDPVIAKAIAYQRTLPASPEDNQA